MPTSNGLNFGTQHELQKTFAPPVKVLFLVDNSSYRNLLKDDHELFTTEANSLFLKMIQAMNLGEKDYAVVSINPEDRWETLAIWARAKVLAPLGASATSLVLAGEKLSKVRGQIIPKTISSAEKTHLFKIVPLFHPDFLLINPAMKRTSWIDLQLIMKLILD